jgi:hypothetical protein
MNRTELVMRRRNVLAFIKADPALVSFVRQLPPTKTPAGGLVRPSPRTLAPQQVRIIHNYRRYTDALVNSEAGEIPDSKYLLLGSHTLDIDENDTFEYMGEHYTVTGIHPFRTESVLAAIDYEGGPNRTQP